MANGNHDWKNVSLSLERPYKGLRPLLDITPEGQLIYEPREEPSKALGTKIARIVSERGLDFFEKTSGGLDNLPPIKAEHQMPSRQHTEEKAPVLHDEPITSITPEDLFKMRMDLVPQLFIAMGEMTHAKELLQALTSIAPQKDNPFHVLTQQQPLAASPSMNAPIGATTVTKPSAIPSVEAFNAQLAIGSKDEALRRAANTFKAAAESMERGRQKAEKYWTDALKVRRMNWGLLPAPLPFGTPTGKGADKTSKDFLISFGLEESSNNFKRRAMARIAGHHDKTDSLVFPYRQHARLRVSMIATTGNITIHSQSMHPVSADDGLDTSLRIAQQEVLEQEIFSTLVQEASNLATASARVSERLVVVDAAQEIELRFDLVDPDNFNLSGQSKDSLWDGQCDLVRYLLYAFLLRRHNAQKALRLGGVLRNTASPSALPPLLQPIIDLLQYHVFCTRVKSELDKISRALTDSRVPSRLRFEAVGDIGSEMHQILTDESDCKLSGESVLRIDNRYTMRLTLTSPSSLTVHLPQVIQRISSIPQFSQLISDEIERYLLTRLCELGTALCTNLTGTWFVDLVMSRCVGKLEGYIIHFSVAYKDGALQCDVFQMRGTTKKAESDSYSSKDGEGLIAWAERLITGVITSKPG